MGPKRTGTAVPALLRCALDQRLAIGAGQSDAHDLGQGGRDVAQVDRAQRTGFGDARFKKVTVGLKR